MQLSKDYRMITFAIPSDAKLLEALGVISLRHAHLDHILRMTIKSLSGVDVQQALDATAFHGSSVLRERINKLGRLKLGEGSELIRLQALLERCKRATLKRNELVHNIWARELDGEPMVQTSNHEWKPIPTIQELDVLSAELARLTSELNEARLVGFLAEAIKAKKTSG